MDQYFICRDSGVTAGAVHHPMMRDAHQPRRERAARIVGSSGCMKRQQDILHQILAVARLQEAKPTAHQSLQQRYELAQEAGIGDAVAILRGLHERRKPEVIGGSLRRGRLGKRTGPMVLRVHRSHSSRRSIHSSLRSPKIAASTVDAAGPAQTPPSGRDQHKAIAELLKYRMAMEPIACCYAQEPPKAGSWCSPDPSRWAGASASELS